MHITNLIKYLNNEDIDIDLIIDDLQLKNFINSYKKHSAFYFNSKDFENFDYSLSIQNLYELKNKYEMKQISSEKYLLLISFFEDYILKREIDDIEFNDELNEYLSNEILLIENKMK